MSGNRAGGLKAAKTNMEKYGERFYAEIGWKGGAQKRPETRWFNKHPELAREWGRIGGKKSKRGPAKNVESDLD